ncbi:MAG: DUF4355 domain-containing protein [Propionibacteriaceae bacterium]|jgi:hypothetical protein|nr:DUF4355 domain-containing protein [Propionibacteriaceae bacterium]
MSDSSTETTPGPDQPTQVPEPEARTFTQAEVNDIVRQRLTKEAQKFAGHDELAKKAAEYDKLVESQKTEAQKQADALAALTAQNAQLQADALRRTVADAKGLPGGLAKNLVGSTQEELEASADELLAVLAPKDVKTEQAKPVVPRVATDGKTPSGAPGGNAERFAEFLAGIRK